ncbi:hypothetical protein OUZ56_008736 [Daphnia magna]|uniref:Uncharacterized protein n=1 Tax=Daphnia magna TaxID=35525 RepID=A0ABR0AE53_9CRUS|nr:hypothetical protein OUZ56_008736 [Daphnia magna]
MKKEKEKEKKEEEKSPLNTSSNQLAQLKVSFCVRHNALPTAPTIDDDQRVDDIGHYKETPPHRLE